eukprot:11454009-Ditylum_brightwellii.AAC.1
MADEQRTSGARKLIQNARTTSKTSTPQVRKKLSKTVEDLAGHQQGFPKGAAKLSEEKSLQKPPADPKVLTLANNDMTEEKEWTTVNNKGKSDMEVEEAAQLGKERPEGTPKRKETSNGHTRTTPSLEQRKRFQPTPYHMKQAPKTIKETDFQTVAEQIKLRGATAIDKATEVVIPVTIEFIVPPLAKVFHIQNAFVRLYQKLKEKDAAIKVLGLTSNTKWDQTDLSNGTEFERLFTATYKKAPKAQEEQKLNAIYTQAKNYQQLNMQIWCSPTWKQRRYS